jgi:type I restriction enzyme, S subunit
MNPEVFFENFELLAAAPNGVQKLRELILQLAVMGKLVEQDPSDEPASALLERIKAEKKKLRTEGKNGSKLINSINVDQIPYEIPSSWEWTTLSECGMINPRNDISDEKEVSFIPMACISEKYGQNVEMEIKKWDEIKKGFTHFAENDVVLAKIIPCFQNGKSAVMKGLKNGFGAGTTELHVFRSLKEIISPNYVLIYLKSPDFIHGGIPKMTGSAGQKRVPKDYFSENPFPLPPLAEQKRIVAKIDELMALCNKLEAHRQKKQELQSKLNSAALDIMLSAENQEEFEQHWQRICANFDLLYHNPGNVEKLRQAILQLAVQGKLIEQDLKDEPASVLIDKVEAERKMLVKQGETKRNKSLNSKKISEASYDLPRGWEWVHFSDIGEFGRGKSKHRPRNDPLLFNNGKYPLVQTGDVARANGVIKTHTNLYNEMGLAQSHIWPKGTLCITIAANIADSAILGFDACFPDSIVGFIPSSEIGSTKYFEYLMRTIKENLENFAPSTAQKNINLGILENVLIPLPPKKELKRIVEKTDQLMGLCDELAAKLRKEREDSEKLMETVIKGLLAGAVAGKPESDSCTPMQAAVVHLK